MTEIAQITNGGQYLIAAKANDGSYYVVNPASGSNNFDHVAKVIKEQVEVKPEAAVQLGNDAQFNGEKKRISECLFTFDKQDDGKFIVSIYNSRRSNSIFDTEDGNFCDNTAYNNSWGD